MKALIKVGYACNQNCGFCHRLDLRAVEASRDEVHGRIERARELGHTMVVLSGGEPTMRPELMEWAAHAASLEMDLGLVTNGQMLSYPGLVDRLCEHRLAYVYLSLHGATAEVHDRVIRAEGFERTRAALDNLAGRGLELVVNTVVTRQNLDHLQPVVDLLLGYPDAVFKLSMVEPRGGGARHFDVVVPRVTDVAARVREALERGIRGRGAASGPSFAHDGIPFCLLQGYEDLYDDLKTNRFATMVEVGEPDFFPVDDRGKVQPAGCEGCALCGPCPGLYALYYERRGDDEVSPVIERPRSNSFNYAFERVAHRPGLARCPLLDDGVLPWARERTLFVREERGIALYRTHTRDFSDREIEVIKHDHGQVYLDVSEKPAVDCFPRDLAHLERSPWCERCPERARCTGMFEPSDAEENAFTRDDEEVRKLLRTLAGEVLDIGCGDGRYADILGPLATAGSIRYLGIDPDAERVQRLAERWPWAEVRALEAESLLELLPRRFDWVVVLRSWNHLRDPRAALGGFAGVLRPGGTLVIADNVAFGLARSRQQTTRGESSTAVFEHYRNHTAREADRLVGGIGLRRIERREVAPETSNQWLLVYRAVDG